MAKRIVTWDEYCDMSDEEAERVSAVAFPPLLDVDSPVILGVEPSAGGESALGPEE